MTKFVFVNGMEEIVNGNCEDIQEAFEREKYDYIELNDKFYNIANLLYFCKADEWESEV